ncbi:MAG TPA: DNA mismatch repair endonuclease MutL [Methylomirabilota bacterium]|nr:DNA mismatch repair endonuclease MutL [Methylomirabilota bacterium]
MNRIRLLPEQVANQIAAGEVVERPASVVKELVENALDAGARRITVEIQAGGRSLIRVTDDGVGMSRDDALLCLERHATSKVRDAEDLAAIRTLGFRGEALPSIASVSRMTLTTREKDAASPEATRVIIHGGRILEVTAAGSPPGTSIEVRQLFYNVPARRKFLRSEETECAHIQHYLTLAALAHATVAFTFIKDSRTVWQLPPIQTGEGIPGQLQALRTRMSALMGESESLLAVNHAAHLDPVPSEHGDAAAGAADVSPSDAVCLWGFIGRPGVSRSNRDDQHLFVNRRPVENRALNFALIEGYHTALMKGRYPVCCLFLEIAPGRVDVNIHPAKREVKFHDERAVRHFVAAAVRTTLLRFHSGPVPTQAAIPTVATPPLDPTAPTTTPELPIAQPASPESAPLPGSPPPIPPSALGQAPAKPPIRAPDERSFPPPGIQAAHSAPESKPARMDVDVRFGGAASPPAPPLLEVPLRLVGVIARLYVVLESDRGLVLLDQHAAHERVLFEQMLGRLEQGAVPSQRLLLPETVELSARDAQFLREHLATFARLGLGLSEFGERTFLLDALPPLVRVTDPRRFVLDVIDELKSAGQHINSQRLGEHTIAKTVCRHAVKANDPLQGAELENLVNDLRRCAMPYTCPHVRPTLIEMNLRELEKRFGRVQ